MQIKNNFVRFGIIAIAFHWLMAIMIIGLLCIGLYMTSLPLGVEKIKLYGLHKEFGLLVLLCVFFRLLWRISNAVPELDLPWMERLAAYSMHWILYLFMIAMPVTGWFLTSAAGFQASFFGLFNVPNLISANESARMAFSSIHHWLAYALIAAISLHTAAALKHHFINRDHILRRMLP